MKMRNLTILATATVLVAGCSSEDIAEEAAGQMADEQMADGDGEVDLDVDEEGGSINVGTSEGTMSMGSGGELSESFPEDLPLPPGDYEVASSFEEDTMVNYSIGDADE